MESPQAAWVDMMMTRLHELERRVGELETENADLQHDLERRAPVYAPGFNAREDFFFWAIVDHQVTITEWSRSFGAHFSDFTISLCTIGEYVEPRAPMIQITGLVRRTGERSCAPISQKLHACLGCARDGYASVAHTRAGDVCEALLAECETHSHRDFSNDGAVRLEHILDVQRFWEYEAELTTFMASGHIHSALRDERAHSGVRRIKAYMTPSGEPIT